MDRSKIRGKA
jgi:serine/threonine-protein kinase ULK/ATG1